MSGAHAHTFVNPAGFGYVIGCWNAAAGCVHLGSTETAFSWFPGWTWQLAACASCRTHLGWVYRGAMLSIDWTPIKADKVPFGDISSNRFRFLVSATTLMKAAPKLHVSFRVGLGADISHVSVQTDLFGVRFLSK